MVVRIPGIQLVAGPIQLIDPDGDWPYALATYRLAVNLDIVDGIPDWIPLVLAALQGDLAVTARVPATQIRATIPLAARPKTPWITVQQVGGLEDVWLPRMQVVIDIKTYASRHWEAMAIWRDVHQLLVPIDRRSFDVA